MWTKPIMYAALLMLGATMGCQKDADSSQKQTQRPNIIFLLTDDQRWDAMGAMGNTIIQTPQMDRLARDGTLFKYAHVTTSICGTSRASLLTGQYERRHGVRNHGLMSDEAIANGYPLLLKKNGYRIGFIGKYDLQGAPIESYNYWKGATGGSPKYDNVDEQGNYIHYTRMCENNALEFLRTNEDGQPFCLTVGFKAPHVQDADPRQFVPDPAYGGMYQDVVIPTPKTAGDEYFYGVFPEWFTTNNESRIRWKARFSTPELYQHSVKNYYRLIYGVDVALGSIRQELERQGLADNTIIIFMGDNGFYLGEHGLAGKWYGHQESIRVPLIYYDPRLPKKLRGQPSDDMVLNVDIAPTILDAAGVKPWEASQGKSFLPIVRGEKPDWRNEFFYEHRFHRPPDVSKIPKSEGVVTRKTKYLRYIESDPMFEELYDLERDPLETNNLATDPTHRDLLAKMRVKCDQLLEAAK